MNDSTDVDGAAPEQMDLERETANAPNPFEQNLHLFIARIDSLLDHGTLAMVAITQSHKQAQARFDAFLKGEASPVEGQENTFTVPEDKFTKLRRLERRRDRSRLALQSVPRGLTVALVSEFDAFMGATLKAFYRLKPNALNATERTMTFGELVTFGSIEAAREHVLEKEVECFLRSSHSAQFDTLESKLGISLRKNLAIWKDFIELTERRNLFVHNDGVVNTQYLEVCKSVGLECTETQKGTMLGAPQPYFVRANETLYELAAKLSHVLWRKVSPDDNERADAHFAGTLIYELLYDKRYRLARTLADFGAETFKKWGSDYYRRALIVNRAQAYIWDGDREGGLRILAAEDWSAASDDFQLCIAALRQDFPEAIRRMRALGPTAGPKKDGFREWPVFRELRKIKDFQTAFTEVFGEPFATVTVASPSGDQSSSDVEADATVQRKAPPEESVGDGPKADETIH
jgi:hypothetical protein